MFVVLRVRAHVLPLPRWLPLFPPSQPGQKELNEAHAGVGVGCEAEKWEGKAEEGGVTGEGEELEKYKSEKKERKSRECCRED